MLSFSFELGYWFMESSGGVSFIRNRRLESFLDTNNTSNVKESQQKVLVKEEEVKRSCKSDVYVDDDGWISGLVSCVRIVTCFLSMMVTTFIWALIMLVLLPWPYQRIRQGNIYGHVTGRMLVIGFCFIWFLLLLLLFLLLLWFRCWLCLFWYWMDFC